MKPLTVGSLFSGIGGIDLGLERAGMVVRWQSEIDPYASRVLAKHWPSVPNLGDITKINWSEVERVDVLCGGFPCQDISNAGKREGIDGKRSGLWGEYARAIRELRPRYVFVENVAALLARGLERVLGDLASLGYDAEWDCIPASALGAPHQRDRLWIIARSQLGRYVADTRSGWGPLHDVRAGRDATRGSGSAMAHSSSRGLEEQRLSTEGGCLVADVAGGGRVRKDARPGRGWWSTEPDVGRVANGVPSRVDRLRGLGNAVVPQIPELIGGWIIEHAKAREAAA